MDGPGASGSPPPSRPAGSSLPRTTGREVVTTRLTSSAPKTKHTAFVANGMAMPVANRKAPIGGATSWFVRRKAPCIRALAIPRSARAHHARQERAAGRVGERLGRTQDEQGGQDHRDAHRPADDRGHEDHEGERSAEVDHDDHPATVEAIRGGPAEDAEHQHRQVLAEDGHRDQERVAASARRPGAGRPPGRSPSPTLLITVAARSHRKLRPSLVGAMVSAGRAISERTGGRIAPARSGRASLRAGGRLRRRRGSAGCAGAAVSAPGRARTAGSPTGSSPARSRGTRRRRPGPCCRSASRAGGRAGSR